MTCTVQGCDRKRYGRGLCSAHYQRQWKGRPTEGLVRQIQSAAERLLAKVEFDTNGGCWLWSAAHTTHGYGCIGVEGKVVGAHRLSYATFNGAIPNGLHVCHRCDTPACVRPDHLFLGTRAENMADMAVKGRAHKTGSKGEANGNAKLSAHAVARIRDLLGKGLSNTAIAARFGVSDVTISRIKLKQAWGAEHQVVFQDEKETAA